MTSIREDALFMAREYAVRNKLQGWELKVKEVKVNRPAWGVWVRSIGSRGVRVGTVISSC